MFKIFREKPGETRIWVCARSKTFWQVDLSILEKACRSLLKIIILSRSNKKTHEWCVEQDEAVVYNILEEIEAES